MKMKYVIYVTNSDGKRVHAKGHLYDSFDKACEASEKMRKENPACKATAITVMRRN
jgi:hypothetical protein